MKALVVYYSRTGTTRKVGHEIARALAADEDEIIEPGSRLGILGYLKSGMEGSRKTKVEIRTTKDPARYSIVIVGTPIWVNLSSPVRSYLSQNRGKLTKVAFFCTMGDKGWKKVFAEMEKEAEKKPVATLALTSDEVKQGIGKEKLNDFLQRIRHSHSI